MSLPLISPPVPARSSVVLPLSIILRKSIVLLPLISLPAYADSPLHVNSQTVNQPRKEESCLCRWSVHPCPLEIALCRCRWSYQEKALCCRHRSVLPRPLICRCTSVAKSLTSRETKRHVSAVISLPAPASLQSYVLATPSSSGEIKHHVAVFDHCLRVYHCGVSAVDQSSCWAHVAQLTKFSSQIMEQNRVLLQFYFDWESYF